MKKLFNNIISMPSELIKWYIYEITTELASIQGVMFRGRIRKLCLNNNINVLVENDQDIENCVRFAIFSGEDPTLIKSYINKIVPDSKIELVSKNIQNPVLSKLKVNIADRYAL